MSAGDDENNPYVSVSTCEAYRQGQANEIRALRREIAEARKSIRTAITIGFTSSTLIIAVIQLWQALQ